MALKGILVISLSADFVISSYMYWFRVSILHVIIITRTVYVQSNFILYKSAFICIHPAYIPKRRSSANGRRMLSYSLKPESNERNFIYMAHLPIGEVIRVRHNWSTRPLNSQPKLHPDHRVSLLHSRVGLEISYCATYGYTSFTHKTCGVHCVATW